MNIESKRFEKFLEYVWDRKLWIMSLTVFSSLFWMLVSFYSSLPEQLAIIERDDLERTLLLSDIEKRIALQEYFGNQITQHQRILRTFESTTKAFASNSTIDTKLLAKELESVTKVRRELSYYLGTLKGTGYQSHYFSDLSDNTSEELRSMDELLMIVERFYITIISGSNVEAERQSKISNELRFNEALSSLVAKKQNSYEQTMKIAKQREIDRNEQRRKRFLFWLRFYGSIPALMIEVVLVIAAYLSFRKNTTGKLAKQPQGEKEQSTSSKGG